MQWPSGQLALLSSLGEVQAGETHLESGMCPRFPGSGLGKGRKPNVLVSQDQLQNFAITKYCSLGGLYNRDVFLQIWRLEVQGPTWVSSFWGL